MIERLVGRTVIPMHKYFVLRSLSFYSFFPSDLLVDTEVLTYLYRLPSRVD